MRKEEIEISLHDGIADDCRGSGKVIRSIAISAERSERFSGKFRRSISLPSRGCWKSQRHQGRYLVVTLPWVEEAKPKKVEVTVE